MAGGERASTGVYTVEVPPMTALRLVVVGVVAAVLGLAQSALAPDVTPSWTGFPSKSDSALIGRARRVARAYIDNLPNFICAQTNRSFKSGNDYGWRQTREAAAEVQFVNGREAYRNVTVNGRRKKAWLGWQSYGEFGTALDLLFRSFAKFTRSGDGVIDGREVAVFRYEMTNPSYGYRLRAKKPHVKVGHRGLVSIEKATGRVLRLDAREMLGIPSNYPYRQVSHSVNYGYVPIGGKPHLLPVRSRWVTRYPRKIERDDIEWTNYRKFGAESTVDFE